MKYCPTCNRTYNDDAMSFCLTDGTQLQSAGSGPSGPDPNATMLAPPPPLPQPPSQNYYDPQPNYQTPPPPQAWSPMPGAHAPQQKRSALPWIIGGAVVLLVLGIGVAVVIGVVMSMNSSNSNSNSNNGSSISLSDNDNSSNSSNKNSNTSTTSNSNSNSSHSNMNHDSDNSSSSSGNYNFSGVRIRLIWNRADEANATKVADRLKSYGADVIYKRIDSGTTFPGKIYYLPGYATQAQNVAAAIADLEYVSPEEIGPPPIEGAVLYLWVVN